MFKRTFWREFSAILQINLKSDMTDNERFLSPLLFAASVLLLFNFSLGDLPEELGKHLFVAETFLAVLFSLQLILLRSFATEKDDKAFELLRLHTTHHGAWFLAKYAQTIIAGVLLTAPTLLIANFFANSSHILLGWSTVAFAFLALLGLGAVGVLLALITLSTAVREALFPLLYFPLTVPVLLAATQGSLAFLATDAPEAFNQGLNWVGLLICFDMMYLTLGYLLFAEFMEPN